jgi:hypothetical protein
VKTVLSERESNKESIKFGWEEAIFLVEGYLLLFV